MRRPHDARPILSNRSLAAAIVIPVSVLLGFVLHARVLFNLNDLWADFIKVVLYYPGSVPAHDPFGFDRMLARYTNKNEYRLPGAGLNHLPPLSVLISIISRRAFEIISPVLVFLTIAYSGIVILWLEIWRKTKDIGWVIVSTFSYPMIFLLDRGNLFSLITAIIIIIVIIRQKVDWLSAILFAIAINIRPNVALVLLAFADWRIIYRSFAISAFVFLTSLVIVHEVLPSYGIQSFFAGYQNYDRLYVGTFRGIPFSSSLTSAIALVGGGVHAFTCLLIGTVIAITSLFRKEWGERVFLAVSGMTLGVPLLADYHLLVFVAPLIVTQNYIVLVASILMLSFKGYGDWPLGHSSVATTQVLINPAILIVSVAAIHIVAIKQRTLRYWQSPVAR